MNTHLKKFIYRGIIISLILIVTGFFLFTTILKEYFSLSFPVLLLIIFLVTVLFHRYLIRSADRNARKFPVIFLGATGIKMGFYLFLIILYIIFDTENTVSFLFCFIILYIIFTVFEVVSAVGYFNTTKDK